jgi:hypothetical protein
MRKAKELIPQRIRMRLGCQDKVLIAFTTWRTLCIRCYGCIWHLFWEGGGASIGPFTKNMLCFLTGDTQVFGNLQPVRRSGYGLEEILTGNGFGNLFRNAIP